MPIFNLIGWLIALLGLFVLVAMLVAPSQPAMRDWYASTACPYLDTLSTDICAAIRRAPGSTNI